MRQESRFQEENGFIVFTKEMTKIPFTQQEISYCALGQDTVIRSSVAVQVLLANHFTLFGIGPQGKNEQIRTKHVLLFTSPPNPGD